MILRTAAWNMPGTSTAAPGNFEERMPGIAPWFAERLAVVTEGMCSGFRSPEDFVFRTVTSRAARWAGSKRDLRNRPGDLTRANKSDS